MDVLVAKLSRWANAIGWIGAVQMLSMSEVVKNVFDTEFGIISIVRTEFTALQTDIATAVHMAMVGYGSVQRPGSIVTVQFRVIF